MGLVPELGQKSARGLNIRVLGGFSLWLDGQALNSLRPGRAQSLLVYLLLHRHEAVPRARVAAEFWPDTSDGQARTNLRRELHNLRKALPEGDYLLIEPSVVQWRPTLPWSSDLEVFQAADSLPERLNAYAGELLPGCHEEWLLPYRDRLRAEFVTGLERLAEACEEQGDGEGALHAFRRLLDLEPLREELYRQAMAVCLRAGDRGRAAALFRQCEEVLARELDLEPDPETVALYHSLTEAPERPPPAGRPPLIGRQGEWTTAWRWLEAGLREGASQLLLVTGEPGIGKTRLLEELQDEMRARGGKVASGRGFEAEQIRAYGPWLDAFGEANLLRANHTADRSQLFDPVVEHLRSQSQACAGLMVVFDDLHWFDEASSALLHYALRLLMGSPVLVAATARSAELTTSPAARGLRSLAREARLREIKLAPLSAAAVDQLVKTINPSLGGETAAGSGGNPLFVVELARAAGGESSLVQLIENRLEQLDSLARELVSWGAVLGRSFGLETLARVSGRPLAELLEGVEAIERQALWRPAGGSYDFAHDVVRDAAYQTLSQPRRLVLHLQAARRLEGAAEVARHAALGQDPELASRAYLEAAQDSLRLLAFGEAAELARRGLAHCPAERDLTRRLALMQALLMAGLPPAELESLEPEVAELVRQAERRGRPDEEGLAGVVSSLLAFYLGRSESVEAASLRTIEKARHTDLATAARLLGHSGSCLACIGRDMARAEAVALEAEELSQRAGLELPDVHDAIALAHIFRGQLQDGRSRLETAVGLADGQGELWRACLYLVHLACLLLEMHELDDLKEVLGELRRTASPLGDESELVFADLLEALADGADTAPYFTRLGQLDAQRMLAFGHRMEAQARLATGQLTEAVSHAEAAWVAASRLELAPEQGLSAALLTEAALAQGDRQGAAKWLRKVRGLDSALVGDRALRALRRAITKKGD